MTHATVRIPLLRDWHTHPMLYAAFADGVNLSAEDRPDQSPAELRTRAVERIHHHAGRVAPGWTIAYGWNSGKHTLSKQDFDDISPVVVFNLSLHGLIVNDAGRALLQKHGIDLDLDNQAWVERNLLKVLNVFASADASPKRLERYFRHLLEEHGIYQADEMLLVDEKEVLLFAESGLLERTRFWAAPDQYDLLPPEMQSRIHGIKLFADGALGSQTAALHRPYRNSRASGMLMRETRELESLLRKYVKLGKPIALHAIGDRAIDQAVDAAHALGLRTGHELRIEHAQFISEPTARRAKKLGISLCMQPNFSDDSRYYCDRLPESYPQRNNPFRMLIDKVGYVPGSDLLFGSDGMPHGVSEGLRQSLFPAYPEQTLTLDEFIAGYCLPDCKAGHIEVQVDQRKRQVSCQILLASP